MRALVVQGLVVAVALTGCDGNPRPTPDGGGDSAQTGDAGDPCLSNPCTTPPAADCASDTERRTYRVPGTCTVVAGAADCAFEPVVVDCGTQMCELGACADLIPAVAWCRLQHPTDGTAGSGELFDAYARVYIPRFTETTTGVDPVPGLVADIGWGPDGTDPETDTGWSWTRAQGNAAWDALAASEPNNDEYAAQLAETVTGVYDLAARFSVDSGATWIYCDTNAGAGSDGSEDDYQTDNAGSLRITADPCEPNPCDAPPPAVCFDTLTLHEFPNPGACASLEGMAQCSYPPLPTNCGQLMQSCRDAACAGPAVDWCRLQWPEDASASFGMDVDVFGRVYVNGLTTVTLGNDTDAALVGDAGYGPVGTDPATDGAWSWTRSVPNVNWDGAVASEPNNDEYVGTLTQPAEGLYDLAFRFSFDAGSSWTHCDLNVGSGADGSEDGYQVQNAGSLTVGPPVSIDWCRLAAPATTSTNAGFETEAFFGEVWTDGVTTEVGQGPGITAQVGYGAVGTDPGSDVSWLWQDADYAGDAAGGANDDYSGTLTPQAAGAYSTAYRFSGDGGGTWTYCDLTDSTVDLGDLGALTVN